MKICITILSLLFGLVLFTQNANLDQKVNTIKGSNLNEIYQSLDGEKISELLDARSGLLTQADNIYGIKIQKNDVFLFVTTELKVGKLQVLSFDDKVKMVVKFALYDFNNALLENQNSLVLNHNRLIDIDKQSTEVKDSNELDLKWGDAENPTLFPQNNISILLLNKSRHANHSNKLKQ